MHTLFIPTNCGDVIYEMSGQTMFFALAAGGLAALYFYRSESRAGAPAAELGGQVTDSATTEATTDASIDDKPHLDVTHKAVVIDVCEQLVEQSIEQPIELVDNQPDDSQPDDKLVIIHDYELVTLDVTPPAAQLSPMIRVPTIRLRTQM